MHTEALNLGDYLVVLRRRKWPLLGVMGLLLVISISVALILPPVYRSTATILTEQKEIPEDLVQTTINLYVDAQIKTVSERVLTSANLREMIQKFNLYPVERQEEPIEVVIDRMRKNIELEPVNAQVIDPKSGQEREATISFTVSFDADSPQLAEKVANELAALFLRENVQSRTEKAADTAVFLSKQAERLKVELSETEKKLAAFKEKNAGRLPELSDMNLRLLEATDRDLMETQRQIRSVKEQQVYLEAQLAQVNPSGALYGSDGKPILTPAERLRSLQAEYASKAAVYAPDHPDIVKMGKEIAGLRKQLGGAEEVEALQEQLAARQAELAAARDRYSELHPDVKRLQREVAALQVKLKEASIKPPPSSSLAKPDNPAYIQLQARLEATLNDLRTYGEIERKLRVKLAQYEQRLTETPQVEREYLTLTRDYESTLAKYKEIRQNLVNARLGESLEKSSRGDRFSVIEPAKLPQVPHSPNRLVIAFAGIVFSMAGGLGAAALAEAMDQTVRGAKAVAELLQVPPLAVIPYIENRQDRRQKLVRWALVGGSIVTLVVLVHFGVMPLELVWSNLLKHLGLVGQESMVG